MVIAKPANLFTVFRLVAHTRHSPVPGARDLDSLLRGTVTGPHRIATQPYSAGSRQPDTRPDPRHRPTPPHSSIATHCLPALPDKELYSRDWRSCSLQAELRSTPFYWHPDVLGGPKGL